MSSILNYAVRHYNLPYNPCKVAGTIGKRNADRDKMTIWTQQEYEKFISFERKKAAKIAFDILFYSGIRSGELLALYPSDILPNKKITYVRTLQSLMERK